MIPDFTHRDILMAAPDPPETRTTLFRQMLNPENREEGWRMFLQRYKPVILGWCRAKGLTEADAEEVASAVLQRLCAAMPGFQYDPKKRFRGWLRTVVENLLRNWKRDQKYRPGTRGQGDTDMAKWLAQVPAKDVGDLLDSVDTKLIEDFHRAEAAMREVKSRVLEHNWQAFWQTAILGINAQEVAQELGIKVAAVFVAKKRVADMLKKVGAGILAAESMS